MSDIESNNSQNGGLEDYNNNISDGIFPHFTNPSIKISLGYITQLFKFSWIGKREDKNIFNGKILTD